MASTTYGASFTELVGCALAQYKRLPGMDGLTRLHLSAVGKVGIDTLRAILPTDAVGTAEGNPSSYIEVRYRLRWHIVRHLQRRLIDDGYATAAMRDDFFATDLGL